MSASARGSSSTARMARPPVMPRSPRGRSQGDAHALARPRRVVGPVELRVQRARRGARSATRTRPGRSPSQRPTASAQRRLDLARADARRGHVARPAAARPRCGRGTAPARGARRRRRGRAPGPAGDRARPRSRCDRNAPRSASTSRAVSGSSSMWLAAAASTLFTKCTETGAAPAWPEFGWSRRKIVLGGTTVPSARLVHRGERPLVGRLLPLGVEGTLSGRGSLRRGLVGTDPRRGVTMTPTRTYDREQRLFELARDALVVTALDGRILRVNPAALELVGLRRGRSGPRVRTVELVASRRPRRSAPARGPRGAHGGDERRRSAAASLRPDGTCAGSRSGDASTPTPACLLGRARHHRPRRGLEPSGSRAVRHAPIGMASWRRRRASAGQPAARAACSAARRRSCCRRTIFDLVDDEHSREALPSRSAAGRGPASSSRRGCAARDGHPAIVAVSATLVHDARQRAAPLRLPDPRHHRAARGPGAPRANEAKLAEAQQIARLGSWEWAIADDRVTWSDELYRIYGVRPDRFPGSYGGTSTASTPTTARASRASSRPRSPSAAPWTSTTGSSAPTATLRMIHARGEVVFDERRPPGGRARHVPGRHREPPRRGRAARRRAALPPRLRRRADRDGAHRPRGPLAAAEPRDLRQMLGRTEPELRATQLSELNHPEDRRLDRPLVKELLAGRRRSFALEKRYVHADGRRLHALVHVSLMHGDGERPLYFLVPARRPHRAPPGRGRAPRGRAAHAGDHRQLAGADHRQGPRAALPARQPPLGGALRGQRRPAVLGRTAGEVLPPRARPAPTTSTAR